MLKLHLLKLNIKLNADNLFYEYMVVNWLNNKINGNFLFFVCMHGLFTYKTDNDHSAMHRLYTTRQTMNKSNKHRIKEMLQLQHYKGKSLSLDEFISLLRMSYTHPLRMCILIEQFQMHRVFTIC